MNELKVKLLSEHATLPTKAHAEDSGFDLYAAENVSIDPGESVLVATDVAIELPKGYEAQVRNRSGITTKTKIRVQLGTVDMPYRGGIGIMVDNISFEKDFYNLFNVAGEEISGAIGHHPSKHGSYYIKKGDKIAQLVVQALPQFKIKQVDELAEGERGENGFGSTGV